MGLVNRVAAPGALEDVALDVARSIAANGPIAVRVAKSAIDGGAELPQKDGLELEASCYDQILTTQDRLEALAAFSEKRKPEFKGE